MSAALPRDIYFDEVLAGDRVRHLEKETVVREITRDGGTITINRGSQRPIRGMQRERLTLVERPAPAVVRCGQDCCASEATVSFFFQAQDGSALSEHWSRCWAHATAPLPETAPEGSIVTMTAAHP